MAESESEAGGRGGWGGAALMVGGALSNQSGAAVGALAFPAIGPAGVVAVRQCVAAVVLLAVGRPRVRTFRWAQWWPVLLLAVVFGTMNLSLYSAIDRVGLGLAATLEFLGPLGVALAASRRRADLGAAALAASGVVVLTRPRASTDYAGIGLALLAALCWAAYIQLNRVIGRRLPGAEGSAAAAGLSALAFLPVGIAVLTGPRVAGWAVGCAVATGVLSSAVPFLADLFALRRVPPRVFGVCMSAHPALGAAVGWVVLGQRLGWAAWLGIAAIVAASVLSVLRGAEGAAERVAASGGAEPPAVTGLASGGPVSGGAGAGGLAAGGPASRGALPGGLAPGGHVSQGALPGGPASAGPASGGGLAPGGRASGGAVSGGLVRGGAAPSATGPRPGLSEGAVPGDGSGSAGRARRSSGPPGGTPGG